jgi:hypothetical protein
MGITPSPITYIPLQAGFFIQNHLKRLTNEQATPGMRTAFNESPSNLFDRHLPFFKHLHRV